MPSILKGLKDLKKVQVGKDQEKAQSEKDSHSKNRGGKKNKLTIRYLYHETYHKPNEQLFPNRWPLSYLNLTYKYENIHKAPTAQFFFLNTKT